MVRTTPSSILLAAGMLMCFPSGGCYRSNQIEAAVEDTDSNTDMCAGEACLAPTETDADADAEGDTKTDVGLESPFIRIVRERPGVAK